MRLHNLPPPHPNQENPVFIRSSSFPCSVGSCVCKCFLRLNRSNYLVYYPIGTYSASLILSKGDTCMGDHLCFPCGNTNNNGGSQNWGQSEPKHFCSILCLHLHVFHLCLFVLTGWHTSCCIAVSRYQSAVSTLFDQWQGFCIEHSLVTITQEHN